MVGLLPLTLSGSNIKGSPRAKEAKSSQVSSEAAFRFGVGN